MQSNNLVSSIHFFTFTLWQGQRGKPLSNISQCQGENILNCFDITIKQYDHQSHSLPSLQSTPCNKSVSLIRSSIGAQMRRTPPAETAQVKLSKTDRSSKTANPKTATQCSRRRTDAFNLDIAERSRRNSQSNSLQLHVLCWIL